MDAIKPERFYLYLTTNGFNADRKMIKELAKHGVSMMSVSICLLYTSDAADE